MNLRPDSDDVDGCGFWTEGQPGTGTLHQQLHPGTAERYFVRVYAGLPPRSFADSAPTTAESFELACDPPIDAHFFLAFHYRGYLGCFPGARQPQVARLLEKNKERGAFPAAAGTGAGKVGVGVRLLRHPASGPAAAPAGAGKVFLANDGRAAPRRRRP